MASAVYGTEGDHILCCVPMGYGKTMGPLITCLLLPPGKAINKIWIYEAPLYNLIIPRPPSNKCWMNQPRFPSFTSGSTTVLVVPLTSIAEEVKQECIRIGIRAVVGSQVNYCYFCRKPVHLHDIIIIMTSAV